LKSLNMLVAAAALVIVLLIAEIVIVRSVSGYEPKACVVYAKSLIPEGTVISAQMLEEKEITLSHAHRLSIKNMGSIEGKKAAVDIQEGEMLLSPKLKDDVEEKIKLADKNNRLFSLELKGDQANGWWILPDQYTDIVFIPVKQMTGNDAFQEKMEYLTGKDESVRLKLEPAIPESVWVLKSIRIAGVIDSEGNVLDGKKCGGKPKYVSLEVSEKEAHFLAYAKANGTLELSIIPAGN
jgi:Flp pilus assembly protein CpaB